MNIVDQLRPQGPELDPEWSEQVLHQIMETPRSRRRRTRSRTGVVVAGVVAAAVAGAGVAVAAGVTPPWVDQQVQKLSTANHGKWGHVKMVEIATFRTPSGEFEVWGGTNAAGGKCLAGTLGPHGRGLPDNYFVGCDDPGGSGLNTFVHDDGTMAYGVSPDPTATSVEFHHGGEVLGVLPVDPETHGWGGVLPRARHVHRLMAVYKDADGAVVGTETLTAPS